MLPSANCSNKVSCLEALVGLESDPCAQDCPPFFVEQLDGIDLNKLSQIAGTSEVSGRDFVKKIIRGAALEMTGDIELLVANGYSLAASIGELCSGCNFLTTYQAGGGIKVHNNSLSSYSQMRITSLNILANVTGNHILILDDKVTPKTFPVTLQTGVIMPVKLPYSTTERDVLISIQDQTVGLAQISCPTQSSCGCGVKVNPALNMIQYSGQVAGIASGTQYGFIPCVNIGCSNDTLICEMVRQMPNIFGLTLLYKVGEKINNNSKLTLRNNRVKAQDNEVKDEEIYKYNGLYRKRLNGTANDKGIRTIISDYLSRRRGDSCIVCDGLNKTSYVTG